MAERDVNILALIAENRIAEAMAEGLFENLPGKGKPLPEDDLASLPDDVRLAFRVLRMFGGMEGADFPKAPDEGVAKREAAAGVLLGEKLKELGGGEAEAFKNLETLRGRLGKTDSPEEGRAQRLLESPYLKRIMERLFRKRGGEK
ncbi:MAG: DUF1992 domain-containing protein [Deltaproteobacteria bacterium]|nr:DUF1992 domain-containing protein [Deltaproteobacteria bacterium]